MIIQRIQLQGQESPALLLLGQPSTWKSSPPHLRFSSHMSLQLGLETGNLLWKWVNELTVLFCWYNTSVSLLKTQMVIRIRGKSFSKRKLNCQMVNWPFGFYLWKHLLSILDCYMHNLYFSQQPILYHL